MREINIEGGEGDGVGSGVSLRHIIWAGYL